MSKDGDFASLMESAGSAAGVRVAKRLRPGQVVEGVVVQIGKDSVFLDVGTTMEGRVERGELTDKAGNSSVQVGDTLRVTVASWHDVDGPLLTLALGRGSRKGGIDLGMLQSAREAGVPVTGTVQSAVKGGLEVDLAGVRAFCPASQVDSSYVADLSSFVGQTLSFRVMEIKDEGRSVVVSRKALLAEEREREGRRVLEDLRVGNDYPGTVISLQKYGAFIELGGGIEGLVHVSELAHSRVERVEDVLSVGEKVTVRLLALEPGDKGAQPRLRLSLKAREAAPDNPAPEPGEVLTGTVAKLTQFGVFVDTPKGNGLVPLRELGIPRGSDYRKRFPLGSEVKVVLVNRGEGGKNTFSFERVAGVEERANYREFTQRGTEPEAPSTALGALGRALQQKLGIEPKPSEVTPAPPARPAAAPAPGAALPAAAQRGAAQPAASPVLASPPAVRVEPEPVPAGVFRRRDK